MYWPYYPMYNYLIPFQSFYTQPYCHPSIPEIKIQHKQSQIIVNQQVTIQNKFYIPFKITLSIQQLQQAGYQSNKTSWGQQQDQLLKQLVKSTNCNWHKIANSMPGRNQKMCYSRYRRIKNTRRNYWKRTQDQKLKKLVLQHGKNWKYISTFFINRTPKILKQHYVNQLAPNVNKNQWTLEQDLKFIQMLNTYGRNWRVIIKQLQGRTITQLKNRYFGRIKRLMQIKLKGN